MLPPWMIEKLEQDRREREAQERPALRIEIQPQDERPARGGHADEDEGPRSSVVIIQVW